MTIEFTGQGTGPFGTGTGTGSTSVSPNLPAFPPPEVGDILILFVATKPDSATINTPTNWTPLSSLAGGAGSAGADTGPVKVAAFYRRMTVPAWTAPTVSITSGSSSWAQMFHYKSTTGGTWDLASTSGVDDVPSGLWLVDFSTDPGFVVGDHVIIGSAIPTDVTTPAQFSGQTLTATGATFSSGNEQSEPDTTTGNDLGGFVWRTEVTAGASSAAGQYSATVGGTTTNVAGVSIAVRVREIPPEAQAGSSLLVQTQAGHQSYYW